MWPTFYEMMTKWAEREKETLIRNEQVLEKA